jgi:hypothetical protein
MTDMIKAVARAVYDEVQRQSNGYAFIKGSITDEPNVTFNIGKQVEEPDVPIQEIKMLAGFIMPYDLAKAAIEAARPYIIAEYNERLMGDVCIGKAARALEKLVEYDDSEHRKAEIAIKAAIQKAEPLGAEFQKVLNDNFTELLAKW